MNHTSSFVRFSCRDYEGPGLGLLVGATGLGSTGLTTSHVVIIMHQVLSDIDLHSLINSHQLLYKKSGDDIGFKFWKLTLSINIDLYSHCIEIPLPSEPVTIGHIFHQDRV